VYHDVAQWVMVRQKALDKGHSRRQVAKETGLSRNTIRKMLLHKLPQPYKPRTPRHPALQQYTATLDAFASLGVTTALRPRVFISEIYRCLKQEEGYTGSYGAVRDYLRFRFTACQASTQDVWEQLYEEIVSVSKKDAIGLLQSLSFNGSPFISSTRLQRLQRDVASLREHEALGSRQARTQQDVDWINRVLRDGILAAEVEGQYCDPAQSKELITRLRGSKRDRNRAMAILAHLRGVSDHTIATALGMSRLTIRRCRRIYESGGVEGLFTGRPDRGSKSMTKD
jgi:transposase